MGKVVYTQIGETSCRLYGELGNIVSLHSQMTQMAKVSSLSLIWWECCCALWGGSRQDQLSWYLLSQLVLASGQKLSLGISGMCQSTIETLELFLCNHFLIQKTDKIELLDKFIS